MFWGSSKVFNIKITYPCNVFRLIPDFYIAKLGYKGVYLFFLFLLQNIDCGYSFEPPRRKISTFFYCLLKIFNFYKLKICISHGQVFVIYLQLIQVILRCDGSFCYMLQPSVERMTVFKCIIWLLLLFKNGQKYSGFMTIWSEESIQCRLMHRYMFLTQKQLHKHRLQKFMVPWNQSFMVTWFTNLRNL